jgi:hypothetical protein
VIYDEAVVRERIEDLLNGPGSIRRYRFMWHTLKLSGMQVPRDVLERIVRELDPERCAERKEKRLRRRRLISTGPT